MSAATNWEDVYRTQTARIAELERENAALNETARKHVAAYYELLEKVRRLEQDLSITRQLRCHEIVESEKEDV